MRKQSLFFLLGFFILQWRPSDGIDCYQQAATSVTYGTAYNVFTCPGNVNQCYKYVCVGSAYYVQKGCLDPQSPTQNCQVIQGQCQSQGGTGACYVCSGNRCNAAPPTAAHPWPLNTLFLASIAFILIPSFFQTNL